MLYIDSDGSLTVGGNSINGVYTLFYVDVNSSLGGSSVKVSGTVSNSGNITLGGSGTGQTTFTANGFNNIDYPGRTDALILQSSPTATTVVNINAPAGFGTAGAVTGFVSLNGNSLLEFASGQITASGSATASIFWTAPPLSRTPEAPRATAP